MPIVLLLFVVFVALPAAAQSGQSWEIRELSGEARVEIDGVQPVALTPGDELAPGQRIATGPSGRVVLQRGEDRIVVSPDSVVGLPAQNDGNFATRILHRLGTILLDVERQDQQHFEVVTPFMTAVVKGTRFTVSVQQGASAVHVLDGLVEVSDAQGRGRALVRPGETASADDSGLALNGQSVDPGTGDTADDTADDGGLTEEADADADTTTQVAANDATDSADPAADTGAASDDGSAPAAASEDTASADVAQVTLPDEASETAAVTISATLGDDTIDIASVTDGLLSGPTDAPGNSGGIGSANAQGNGLGLTSAPGQSGNVPAVAQGTGPSRVAKAGTSGNNGNSANNGNAGNGPPSHSNAGGNGRSNNGDNGNRGNSDNRGKSGNNENNGNNGNNRNNGNNENGNNGRGNDNS